jgi:hypothetical protein
MNQDIFSDARFVEPPVASHLLGDGWEADRAAQFFANRRPSDLTAEVFERDYPGDWASSHYLLTNEAFLHFLPSLMRIAREARDKGAGALDYSAMLGDSLRTALARMARGEMPERLNALMAAYSTAQLRQVAQFFVDEVSWEGSEEFDGNRVALVFWRQLI